MTILKKIWRARLYLYSLPSTIFFNFRHFPFKEAIKLPVFLYRPKLSGKGIYKLEGPVSTGKIRLGFPMVSIYRETGIVLENDGMVVFKGKTLIGGGGAISVGKTGVLSIGDNFCNQTGGKIVCYHKIDLGHTVRLGWNCLICDTDFHSLKSEDGNFHTKGFGKIVIGDEVWIGSYSKIFKNTEIPDRCTVASNTVINKKVDCQPYSLIYSGGGLKTKQTGLYRDINDDKINYSVCD